MLTAETVDGLKFKIDGEILEYPEGFGFIKTAFDGFAPSPHEGEPEALFYYTFIEPFGFILKEYIPAPEEPETIY
jgi:hypothetical protein